MNTPVYLHPVAYHRDFTHRLLLQDEAGCWYLWHGDGFDPVEVERPLADWLRQRPELNPVGGCAMWFAIASLPVSADSESCSEI